MFIEIRYINGSFERHINVENWYLNNAGKLPMLQISESPSVYGKKDIYINLTNVLHYDVIDEKASIEQEPKNVIL